MKKIDVWIVFGDFKGEPRVLGASEEPVVAYGIENMHDSLAVQLMDQLEYVKVQIKEPIDIHLPASEKRERNATRNAFKGKATRLAERIRELPENVRVVLQEVVLK